jgi:transcriptional regulator with XRE-family HTH domain
MPETLDDLLRRRIADSDYESAADRCGVSVRALYTLRRGESVPRRATIRAIAAALRVPRDRVAAAIAASRAAAGR